MGSMSGTSMKWLSAMADETETVAPKTDPPIPALRDEIAAKLADLGGGVNSRTAADAIMEILNERGHYLPGAPCAQIILDDAKSLADRLTIHTLALRLLNMLAFAHVQTPETTGARKWLDDHLEGQHPGPGGTPERGPARRPGT